MEPNQNNPPTPVLIRKKTIGENEGCIVFLVLLAGKTK